MLLYLVLRFSSKAFTLKVNSFKDWLKTTKKLYQSNVQNIMWIKRIFINWRFLELSKIDIKIHDTLVHETKGMSRQENYEQLSQKFFKPPLGRALWFSTRIANRIWNPIRGFFWNPIKLLWASSGTSPVIFYTYR